MGKLIDADVFDSILQDAQAKCKKNGGNFRFGVLNSVRANLANQPTVDAAPLVHGRWKVILNPFWDAECSECGYTKKNGWEWGFCPHCGAKMDGERRENHD